ncbi:AAHS family 4-hydroxybenzoate transporter-like MFS transporter [Paucimonas lemoignei]|uniref:AAHS family 4-hydroxybenzoate transporter-like MFS transporter n=1 Tax=Paucimonas lemoignei TaxID=29443 RepID=A0A4R3HYH7_PAULE|nr:MFS transporter [Paucimonas lemoignei]TCS37361.1 AAHS family 4-hydroxybenzoate transporter-like MFS transporter [Paucimonas lemoignei]
MNTKYSIPELINDAPLTSFQWRVFILCFLVAIFDGFDTQAVAFTGPALIQAFNLGPGALAPVMTAGTIGMVLGAMSLGLVGDKIGRRPAILGAVALFGGASLATAFATTTEQIFVLRFLAGLGMGGATPVVLSLAAEYGPSNKRGTIMTTVLLGLPAGAILGGLLAAKMLPVIGWQGIFAVGGLVPLALLVILAFALPESLYYMAGRKDKDNTAKIDRIIGKIVRRPLMAHASYTVPELEVKTSVTSLFADGLARNTIAIWTIYLFNWVAWFMFLSWLPTVLKASGLPATSAPMGTVAVNAVFVVCAIPLATILPKMNTRMLLLALFILGMLVSVGLANSGTNWTWVFILAGAAGLGIGGQQIVLNYMVAEAYPTALRATATGWAIALGRVGAILGSASGGWVLEQGGPSGFYMTLVLPLAIAAAGLAIIKTVAANRSGTLAAAH